MIRLRHRRRRDEGQATVEAALTLPIVLLALLMIVQVGLVVRDALALTQAAREGARAAAISGTDDAAATAVRAAAGPLDGRRIAIEIEPGQSERARDEPVTVRLAYEEQLRIPIVSRIMSLRLPLRSVATMRLERDLPTPSPSPLP